MLYEVISSRFAFVRSQSRYREILKMALNDSKLGSILSSASSSFRYTATVNGVKRITSVRKNPAMSWSPKSFQASHASRFNWN